MPPSTSAGEPSTAAASRARAIALDLLTAAGFAGLGLLVWRGLSDTLLRVRGLDLPALHALQHATLLTGGLLALACLPSLLRAPSPMIRRIGGVLLICTWGLACAAGWWPAMQSHAGSTALAAAVIPALLCTCALATLARLAALPGEPSLLLPARMAQALQTGAMLFFATMMAHWQGYLQDSSASASLLLLTAMAGALLLALWRPRPGQAAARVALAALAAILLAPLLLHVLLTVQPGPHRREWWLALAIVLAGQALGWSQDRNTPPSTPAPRA